ncbi:MAG: ribosome silencing factor [Rhizobiales bacterium]|nr:ribosome silencing factor [Hyphomicrobiales bacterium]
MPRRRLSACLTGRPCAGRLRRTTFSKPSSAAIADHLARDIEEAGGRVQSIEGMPHCDWVLIDAGDVIVHVFRPEVRSFYNIEKMWAPDAPASGALRQVAETPAG